MIIPTGEYSDNSIHRYINRKKNSLLNNVGDSLLIFSHNYHRSVDDAINLYISLGEVSLIKNSNMDNNSKGLLNKINASKNRLLNEKLIGLKRNSEKKKEDIKELKKQMNTIDKIDIKKYLLDRNDAEAIKKMITDKEIADLDAEMLSSLIVDYENLKVYTLNQDYSLAKSFLENESDPNYEIELIKNEKSRSFMKYQEEYRNYINSIENIIKRHHVLDDNLRENISEANANIRNMITNSIEFVKDAKLPSDDVLNQSNDLVMNMVNSSKMKKEDKKELLDPLKYIIDAYSKLINIKKSDVVKTTTERINNSTSQQETEKNKKTFN